MNRPAFNIAIVDDDPRFVSLVKECSETLGEGETFIANSSEEMIDLLANTNIEKTKSLDLAIIDLHMEDDRAGFRVLEFIKSNDALRLTPVVMVSISRLATDVEDSYDLGANSYLSKSISYDDLKRDIAETLHYWLTINRTPSPEMASRPSASPAKIPNYRSSLAEYKKRFAGNQMVTFSNLFEYRTRAKLSRSQIANAAKVQMKVIVDVEKSRPIRIGTMMKIVDALERLTRKQIDMERLIKIS
jgi:CheY-like chemotaxis protein